ncbi:hypothetical protein RFI_04704, partial [Reticulomyxa filosa]
RKKGKRKKKMLLDAQKLGFHSQMGLVIVLIANFVCALYSLWLLYVVWRNLWTITRARVGSDATQEIQLSTQKSTIETSVSVTASEKDMKRPVVIDSRIKWIVTLYVFGCAFNCAGTVVEPLSYALVDSPGQACPHGLYVAYSYIFIQGAFYSFYLIRAVVILQGTVFAVPKCRRYFLAIAPVITFGCIFIVHNVREQFNHCNETGPIESLLNASFIISKIFWDITLFAFLGYHIYKISRLKKKKKKVANLTSMSNNQCQKDLKDYLKKLLRLSLVSECSGLPLYVKKEVSGIDFFLILNFFLFFYGKFFLILRALFYVKLFTHIFFFLG